MTTPDQLPRRRNFPGCRGCGLHRQARSIGIGPRPAGPPNPEPGRGPPVLLWPHHGAQALLVIGEAPGYYEDLRACSWVGRSGGLLHDMLRLSALPDTVDCWLDNACRCRPPQNTAPSPSQLKACRPYLLRTIRRLYRAYGGRLTLLCAGASAVTSLLGQTLTDAINQQGQALSLRMGRGLVQVPVYSTYHPANLLPPPPNSRRPSRCSLLPVVRDHLLLLHRRLSTATPSPEAPPHTLAENPPEPLPEIISLDIETYGALQGREQTVFHPARSAHVDGVPPPKQVLTVALAWWGPQGEERATVFLMGRADHRAALIRWLWSASASPRPVTLIGQNILFDLMYLRAHDPVIRYALRPGTFRLEDLLLWNFLQSELRPERALKPLSKLFDLVRYGAHDFNFSGPEDPALLAYNALDALAVLRGRRLLHEAIRRGYGTDAKWKLGPLCRDHCNELLWSCLHLSESGVPYSLPKLRCASDRLARRTDRLLPWSQARWGLLFGGAGSRGSVQQFVDGLVARHELQSHPLLRLTEKTREVSTSEDNLVLIREALPPGAASDRMAIRALLTYRSRSKLLTTYVRPLLDNPARGISHPLPAPMESVGMAYPTWHLCPSRFDMDRDSKAKGTIQGRITCTRPAEQTAPPSIRACRASRFPRGVLLSVDLARIELRIAAYLFRDPVMLSDTAPGRDPHLTMGDLVYSICTSSPSGGLLALARNLGRKHETVKLWRDMGKTTNFLVVYEGEAPKLAETIRRDTGYVIPLDQAQRVIDAVDSRYLILRQNQESLVQEVSRKGYAMLPTGWSRSFLGGASACQAERATIVNCRVQTFSAQLLQSSQAAIVSELERRRLRTRIDLNTYDALRFDCPPHEVPPVLHLIQTYVAHPPLLSAVEPVLGPLDPLEYEVERIDT